MRRQPAYPLTVFYDASCPLCATEIHALRDNDRSARLQLVDCSAPGFDDAPLAGDGIRRTQLMARIHARDARGHWFTGMGAFEAIYRAAGMERTAKLWGNPKLQRLFDCVYPWIARYRQALSRLGLHHLVRLAIRAANAR